LTNQIPLTDVDDIIDVRFIAPALLACRPGPTPTEPNTSLDGFTLHRYAVSAPGDVGAWASFGRPDTSRRSRHISGPAHSLGDGSYGAVVAL